MARNVKAYDAARKTEQRASERDITLDLSTIGWAYRRKWNGSLLAYIEDLMVKPPNANEDRFAYPFGGSLFSDQVEQIHELEYCIRNGTRKALAAFRGGGKTSIARCGMLWGWSEGIIPFGVLFGATVPDANNNIEAIKSLVEWHGGLEEHYPEIIQPVKALEGSSRRAQLLTIDGELAGIEWGSSEIQAPVIPEHYYQEVGENRDLFGNGVAGIMMTRSIAGAARGLNKDGRRPTFSLLDDIETEDSAASETQTAKLRKTVANAVRGLSSRTKGLGMYYIGTIQNEASVTYAYVNDEAWRGRLYKYMPSEPINQKLWKEYVRIRGDKDMGGIKDAQKYYADNRAAMDEGAELSWAEGFDPKLYASGVEYYYAEMADGGEEGPMFCACELQNDPALLKTDEDKRQLSRSMILARTNGLLPWKAPSNAKLATGFCDVHGLGGHIFWVVSWWADGFKGGLVAFGKWPQVATIGEKYAGMSEEAAIYQALADCEEHIMAHDVTTDEGNTLPLYIGEDSGAGQHQPLVFQHCRSCKTRNYFPTKGEGTGGRQWHTLHKTAKVRGDHWAVSAQESKSIKMRVFTFDADYWKSFICNRLMVPLGDVSAYSLYGRKPEEFAELSHHWVSEQRERLQIKDNGYEFDKWRLKRGAQNHWWDGVVGSAAMASVHGIRLPVQKRAKKPRRRGVRVRQRAM
jgi:hypothetical protein